MLYDFHEKRILWRDRQKGKWKIATFCRDEPMSHYSCESMPTDSNEQKTCRQTKNFHNFPMTDKRETPTWSFFVVIIPRSLIGVIRCPLTPMNRKYADRQKIFTIFR